MANGRIPGRMQTGWVFTRTPADGIAPLDVPEYAFHGVEKLTSGWRPNPVRHTPGTER